MKISVGDKVLVKKLSFEGKHKIQDKFEEDVYTVIEQSRPEIPVYKVKSDTSNIEKTLHRNHLLLVDYNDENDENIDEENTGPREKGRIKNKDASNKGELIKIT